MSGGYKTGDFIRHSMKGYGFVVRKMGRNEIGWSVYHPNTKLHLRRDIEGFMVLADREPTDKETVMFVTFMLAGEQHGD